MGNAATVQAIEDNLTAILIAQGFKVEDLSTDPDADVTPLVVILFEGETFEETSGQRGSYNTVRFTLAVRFSDKATASARDRSVTYAQLIRKNVTVNNLNVNTLADSKLVKLVIHTGYQREYATPIVSVDYPIEVTYRET